MEKAYAAVIINRRVQAVDRIFHYHIPQAMQGFLSPGCIVRVPFQHEILDGIVVELAETPEVSPDKVKDILEMTGTAPLFSSELLALGEWLADYYLCPKATAFQAMLPAGMNSGRLPRQILKKYVYLQEPDRVSGRARQQKAVLAYLGQHNGALLEDVTAVADRAILRAMTKKNLIRIEEKAVWNIEKEAALLPLDRQLTKEQQSALAAVREEAQGQNRPVLLFGVTGSGKTEVYVQRAKEVLAAGRQVLFLVPEISLTPQMIDMLAGRLGKPLAVLHSGLLDSERRQTWLLVAQGKYDVVVGARSAVFAPLNRLGLIIMDEEHEQSYKQEQSPRFHARETAKERCRLTGAQLLMGSATPALESYYRAQNGAYRLVFLPSRIGGLPLAAVEVVDMRQELQNGNRSIFSYALQQALGETLKNKKQAVLFLNRRGFATFVSCRHCGYVVECPHCSLALAYHQKSNQLKCHSCGYVQAPPILCPNCGGSAIRHFGTGTQKVAEETAKLFPEARIARLDRDSIEDRGTYEKVYRQMKEERIDILVGTQMVAKGLDFPQVALVGVIAADTSLNLPEMTAGERTFQLLTQVAGRAGRKGQGKVIIQTYRPEQDAIEAAAAQDYALFYQQEIKRREAFQYPPFSHIIRLVVQSGNENQAKAAACDVAGYLKESLPEQVVLAGPAPAPYSKVQDRYRFHLMLRGKDLAILRQALAEGLAMARKKSRWAKDIQIHIDVEPMSMM